MSPLVVIIGPPGAGKSTVAAVLAQRLGTQARDTDADIEQAAGRTVSEIFVDDGEPAFRELEQAAVQAALAEHDGVLALGGGAVMNPLTENALRSHRVVFLDVQITDAAKRIGFNRDRPLLVGNPRSAWINLMEARRPVYERAATVTVPNDGRTPAEVTDAVIAALHLQPMRGPPDCRREKPGVSVFGIGGPQARQAAACPKLLRLAPDLARPTAPDT